MTKSDKMIARAIICAHASSDAGKLITSDLSDLKFTETAWNERYRVKVKFIVKALTMITHSRHSMFNYWCVEDEDQNGYESILVYFEFKIEGKRYQVSFHNPWNMAHKELSKYINTGRQTRWNKHLNGSRDACIKLSEII